MPSVNFAKPSAAAPRVSPAGLAHWRRLLAAPIAVALVLGAPGLAYATFTARTAASLSVGTYRVPAPPSVTASMECTKDTGQKGASITFSDIGDVDRATEYTATFTSPGGVQSEAVIRRGRTSPFTMDVMDKNGSGNGSGKGTYTFALSAKVGSWTGAPLERFITC